MHLYLLTCCYCHVKHLKNRSHNAQNRRSGKLSISLFETYKNSVRPHGCHIYNYTAYMDMAKMCPCPSQHHGLPHWKYVLLCCDKCPGITIICKDTNKDEANTCSKICFHVYRNASHCTVRGIRPYEEQTICSKCSTDISYVTPEK